MVFTKEKLVFAVAVLIVLASLSSIRRPTVEAAPQVPGEDPPRPPRITVPVPPLHPERALDPAGRDPFVPASAWVPASPALLGLPPEPSVPRALPGGALPGSRGRLILVGKEPVAVEEPK